MWGRLDAVTHLLSNHDWSCCIRLNHDCDSEGPSRPVQSIGPQVGTIWPMTASSRSPIGRLSPLDMGDTAPDFELRRSFEENVRLSALLDSGPVLVAFYVFDFGHV